MQEFITMVRVLWQKKAEVDELKEKLAKLSGELEAEKARIMKLMDTMGIDKQHVPDCGTVYRQKSFSVQVPKEPSDKSALFTWIAETKGKDVLDSMLSIHSQTLNSFYKAELEIAKETGNVDFALPGIKPPEVYYTLNMRK